jgi:peptidyl-prolyl cis-trans isomerase A (cyclophilin A)
MRLRDALLLPASTIGLLGGALFVLAPACSSSKGTPVGTDDAASEAGDAGDGGDAKKDSAPDTAPAKDPLEGCTRDPGAGDAGFLPDGGADDPVGDASFDLDAALSGFPAGAGVLTAVITTETGETLDDGGLARADDGGLVQRKIVCKLDEAKAPKTVANFIGLARGTRPAMDATGAWKLSRFYDGLTWHRVIAGFVIQGGDPAGDGSGGPGYDIPNENHVAEPTGTLAMAAGSTTLADGGTEFTPSGSQIYIVVGAGPSADYNVFGSCVDTDGFSIDPTADLISQTKVGAGGKPRTKLHMWKVEIGRCPK